MNEINFVNCIDGDEATIQSFMRDPEFADYLMSEVIADGDIQEIAVFQELYDEAKTRMYGMVAQA